MGHLKNKIKSDTLVTREGQAGILRLLLAHFGCDICDPSIVFVFLTGTALTQKKQTNKGPSHADD